MKKSTTGIVAGALGLGLLAGGSTFALWSDVETVNAGKITAGNLDVALSDQEWLDLSEPAASPADRAVAPEDGVVIPDISEFLTVPGDTLQMSQDIQIELTGDNIAAELVFAEDDAANGELIDTGDGTGGVTLEYRLYEGDDVIAEGDAIDALNHSFTGATDVTYRIETTATFDENTTDQVRTQTIANLQTYTATLDQVRR